MKKNLTKIIISSVLLFTTLLFKIDIKYFNEVLFVISYIVIGYDIVLKAIRNISRGNVFDENFLMTVATIGAICIGNLAEAVSVMLFYQVGELFQSYAVDKSRKSISDLMDIRPDYANVIRNDKHEKVDPSDVNI